MHDALEAGQNGAADTVESSGKVHNALTRRKAQDCDSRADGDVVSDSLADRRLEHNRRGRNLVPETPSEGRRT